MSGITFNVNLNSVTNLVYALNSGVARIGCTTSGASGLLSSVSSVAGATTVNWSLSGGPSWLSIDSSGNVSFASVNVATIGVYNFSVVATDATNSSNQGYVPVTIEVLPNLYIKESGSLTTIACTTYNPAVSNQIIGLGSDNSTPLTGVKFITPVSMPAGLNFRTDGDHAYLYANIPTLSNPRGGITQVGAGQTVVVRAYKEGTLYDHPNRALTLTLTYNVTAASAGNLELGISAYADAGNVVMGNIPIRLYVRPDILTGTGDLTSPTSFTWSETGASGAFTPPVVNSNTALWYPSGNGVASFTVVAAGTGTAAGTYTSATATINVATSQTWTGTNALKLIPTLPSTGSPVLEVVGSSGSVVTFGVQAIDIQVGDGNVPLTAIVTPLGSPPAPALGVSPSFSVPILTNAAVSSVLSITIPSNAVIGNKYLVAISAPNNNNSSPTRTGNIEFYVVCSGPPAATVTASSTSVSITAGTTYTTASPLDTFTPGVAGSTISLVNAPPGLSVDQATGKIIGNVLTGGAGSFRAYVSHTGNTSTDSYTINYTITTPVALVTNLALTTPTPTLTPGSNLVVNWGYTGTIDSFSLQLNNNTPITLTTASTYTFTSLPSTATISLKGTNAVGEFFSTPLSVLVSNSGTVTRLPASPTIATLDENNLLTVNWSPIPLGVDPTAYYANYANWNIIYKYSNGAEVIPAGAPFTGGSILDSRVQKIVLNPPPGPLDTVYLDMQGFSANPTTVLNSLRWDTIGSTNPMKAFPSFGTVTLNKNTVSIGEPLQITIANFIGTRWRIVFSDGTSTSWIPTSITTTAISFTQGNTNQIITVELQYDYPTSLPPVKLSKTHNYSVYVINQQYNPLGSNTVTGDLGLGGEAGFQVVNATDGTFKFKPYSVIVKTLVKDEVTNELKLMVATARSNSASSLLGTLALDVFPILGRPHFKDLIRPVTTTITQNNINSPVSIKTTVLPNFIIGQYNSFNLSAQGGQAPYSWYATGLPSGLTLSADGSLYGTVLALGTTAITFSVVDASEPEFIDEVTLNLTTVSDLTITTSGLPSPTVGSLYSQKIGTTGGVGPFHWLLAGGQLPPGLSIDPNTGILSGYPTTYNSTTDFSKVYTFSLQVSDSVGAIASKQYTATITPQPLSVGKPNQTTLYNGEKFRISVPIYGGKAPYVNVSVTDTNNIVTNLNTNIRFGLVDFDIPETVAIGNYTFTFTITDSLSNTLSSTITYSVRPALGQARLIDSLFDNYYSATESGNHYITLTTVTGATIALLTTTPLSNGIALSYNDTTKQLNAVGPVNTGSNLEFPAKFSVTGTSADGNFSRTYALIGHTGAFTSASPGAATITFPPMYVGQSVGLDFQRPYYNTTGSLARNSAWTTVLAPGFTLPPGLSLDSVSGLIYGTVLGTNVTSTTLQFLDATSSVVGTFVLNFNIIPAPKFTLDFSGLGTATRGTAYTGTIVANAPASLPVTANILKGSLPAGLTMSVSGGTITISGTPTEGGYFDLWLDVVDSIGNHAPAFFKFEVGYSSVLRITTDTLPLVRSGSAYTATVAASGGITPYSFSLASGSPALPAGLTLSSAGILSGTTTATNYNQPVIFQVTDNAANVVTKIINVVVDQGLILTTYSGTDLGNWPQYQPQLGPVITPVNYGTAYPFTAFMVRVAGLTGASYTLNGATPAPSDSPFTFTTNNSNIAGTLVDFRNEGGIGVGYVRLYNVDGNSPFADGVATGAKSLIVTASDGTTRTKTNTFSYTVTASSNVNRLEDNTGTVVTSTIDITVPPNGAVIHSLGFIEGPAAYLYISDGTVDSVSGLPAIGVGGINLNTIAIDPVQYGLIRIQSADSVILSKYSLQYVGPASTGGAVVKLVFSGGKWNGVPTIPPSVVVRIADLADYVNTVGSNYTFDAFLGQSSSNSFLASTYRDVRVNVYQIVSPLVATYTNNITTDQSYSFQINFDEPLNAVQNPTVTVSGLQGVTSQGFTYTIIAGQSRINGYKVSGLWASDSLTTYPKVYNISVSVTETVNRVALGVLTSSLVTYINQTLTVTVAKPVNGLSVVATGDLGVSTFDEYEYGIIPSTYSSLAAVSTYPTGGSPLPIYLTNAAGGSYKITISGVSSTDIFYGNSKLNLPRELYLYTGSQYFSISDIYTAYSTGGVTFTGVASGSNVLLCNLGSLPIGILNSNFNNTISTSPFSNYLSWPQPSVASSTDYSTENLIVSNAQSIGTHSIVVNVSVTEISTGRIASGQFPLALRPKFSSNWQTSPLVIAARNTPGTTASTGQEFFTILGWYYDKNNPSEYNLATFPDDGTASFSIAPTGGTVRQIYVFAAAPFIGSATFPKFSRLNLQTVNGITVTYDPITTGYSDPVLANIINLGASIYAENGSTATNYSNWPFLGGCVNRYAITASATSLNNQLILDVYNGAADTAPTTFSNWNTTVGNKAGYVKYKTINIKVDSATPSGCVTLDSMISMWDGSKKRADLVQNGDLVLSLNPVTKEFEGKRVLSIIDIGDSEIITIVLDDDSKLKCSTSHRLFSTSSDAYVEAKDLWVGDSVSTPEGSKVVVELVRNQIAEKVMTFTIEDNHNYYAENMLSHNKLYDCVEGDSLVTMADGSLKRIDSITAGDVVVSYNEKSKEFEHTAVLCKFKTRNVNRVTLKTSKNDTLSSTETHVYLTDKGWKTALEIVNGLETSKEFSILDSNKSWIKVVRGFIYTSPKNNQDVYLAEVEKNHNLIINGYLVHNVKYQTPGPF